MPEPDVTPNEAPPSTTGPTSDAPYVGAPQDSTGAPPDSGPAGHTIIDSITEFVQLFVDYVRQETESVVHDKVVLPTQQAGMVVAFALAAAMTLFLGIAFLAVGSLMLLAHFVGWIAAMFIVGAVLVAGAGAFSYAKVRKMQS